MFEVVCPFMLICFILCKVNLFCSVHFFYLRVIYNDLHMHYTKLNITAMQKGISNNIDRTQIKLLKRCKLNELAHMTTCMYLTQKMTITTRR